MKGKFLNQSIRKKRTIYLLFTACLFVLTIPEANAKQGEEGDIPQALFGCTKVSTGKVRVVDYLDQCLPSEQAVTFTINQSGRRCEIGGFVIGYNSEGKMICSDGKLAPIKLGKDCPHNLVTGADITNCDLRNQDLRNLDLSNSIATGAIFNNSDLTGTDFSGSSLEGAQFTGTNISSTKFNNTVLNNIIIGNPSSPANATSASFANVSLQNAQLYFTGEEINFTQANLVNAYISLTGGNLTNFTQANLANANLNVTGNEINFTEANLADSYLLLTGNQINFLQADLTGSFMSLTGGSANFELANLASTRLNPKGSYHIFKDAILNNTEITYNSTCEYCDFSGVTGDSIKIYAGGSGSMQGMNFDGANLTNISLYSYPTYYNPASFNYSSFVGATLTNLYIYGNFRACNFEDVTLIDSSFNAAVSDSIFDNANLANTKFYSKSKFWSTSFVGADLSNTRWYFSSYDNYYGLTQLNQTDFTNADLSGAYFQYYNIRSGYEPIWNNTTCPNETNSNDNGGTCSYTLY